MAQRTRRYDMPIDPAATIRALAACRSAMIGVLRVVKPMGAAYHAASMVMSAIDGMASFLTGARYYFSASGSTPMAPQREGLAPIATPKEEPPCP